MKNQGQLKIMMVAPELPSAGANMTGSPAHIYKISRQLEASDISVSHFSIDRAVGESDGRDKNSVLVRMLLLFKTLVKNRPDVLHCHGHKAAFFSLLTAKPLGIPVICEIHGFFNPSARNQSGARPALSRLLQLIESPTLRFVDHIIAQAQSMKDHVIKKTGYPSAKATVFYPGLRVSEFSEYSGPVADIVGVPADEKIILYAGSTYAYQGLDLLAKAQAVFVKSRKDVSFVLVVSNNDGDEKTVLEQHGFLPQWTKVILLDDNTLLPAYLKRADVLVHTRPDTPDNLNVQSKLGLYLASGKPIVTTNVGDYPFILSGSRGCILVGPEEHQIALALVEAVNNPEVSSYARIDNPLLASRYFDTQNNIDRLISLYRKL